MAKKKARGESINILKNKKALWCVMTLILMLGAFAFGRDSGMRSAGAAALYGTMYAPADAYANYAPPVDVRY